MSHSSRFGANCAIVIPFHEDGAVDTTRLAQHAHWVLSKGVSSFTLFGTTGEGASFGLKERAPIRKALAEAGLSPKQMVEGITATSWVDAAEIGREALEFGVRNLLVTPPFYFKGVADEGLYQWFVKFFEALGPQARDVILYTIPSVTQTPLSLSLITRLAKDFPKIVVGVKDSTGDWEYSQKLIAARGDLFILIGNETKLSEAVRMGAEGCISGLANLLPDVLVEYANGRVEDTSAMGALVEAVLRYPVTPAIKAAVAHMKQDDAWARTRAPFLPLSKNDAAAFVAAFEALYGKKG